jgi:hypothetical protein
MDTHYHVNITARGAAARATADADVRRPITLLCITLVVLALAAPLLVTLPQTLDAAASPAPVSATASTSAERFYRAERAGQDSGVDIVTADELAVWRMRSSD